ncbi:MAG: hypothetical protein CML36_07295 [Rhodobacteraceae bacterium]|nr:hypothetical protein [Paracoccaceae bacterium]
MTLQSKTSLESSSSPRPFQYLEDDMSLFFEELNLLRESGTMNMFGAPRWLRDNYELSREESNYVFKQWTEKGVE